ncbi:P-loop containing nucleoside triphosphate hydrolase protein, partial [Vararia minispora EC-137]
VASHLTCTLAALCISYAVRDLAPLLVRTATPADATEGPVLWAKIALLYVAGAAVPLLAPRRAADPHNPTPFESTASPLSLLTYAFVNPTLHAAAHTRGPLCLAQLPPLALPDTADAIVRRTLRYIDVRPGARRRHLFGVLVRVFAWEYAALALLLALRVLTTFIPPLAVNRLLHYVETSGADLDDPVRPAVWIALLFFGPLAGSLVYQRYIFITTRSLVRTRAGLTQLVFERAMLVRSGSSAVDHNTVTRESHARNNTGGDARKKDDTGRRADMHPHEDEAGRSYADTAITGTIANLVTTDVDNVVQGRDFLMLVVFAPLQCAVAVWFLYSLLGWSAFVGTAATLVLAPLPALVVRRLQVLQRRVMRMTDRRVSVVVEMMSALRMIKLFGWERRIARSLEEKRAFELRAVRKRELAALANDILNCAIPVLVMVASYAAFTMGMKQELTPATVFASMAVFDMLRGQLSQVAMRVPPLVKAKVSLDRLTAFLYDTEVLDPPPGPPKALRGIVGIRNACFTWAPSIDTEVVPSTPNRRPFSLRIHGTLVFKPGGVNLVVGPTGAGKTALLLALLGEMRFGALGELPARRDEEHPQGDAWVSLPRESGVAYAAQESWVLNETIRDNILFGAPYDAARYDKVIYQCALTRDLARFAAGDRMEVGERGLTLSGGQKARIALARAVYSRAQVLLLDDVLAALDVHTARWIVDKCFKGDLLRGRTVIFVTHNAALVSPAADYVIALEAGRVVSAGSMSDVVTRSEYIARATAMVDYAEVDEELETEVDHDEEETVKDEEPSGKLILAEEMQHGRVSWPAMNLFFSALGGDHAMLFWTTFVGMLVAGDLVTAGQTYFVGWWSEQYKQRPASEVNVPLYLGVFVILLGGSVFARGGSAVVFVFGSIRAAKKIHERLIAAILGTTLRWLDTTPTSRVITRCTQDVRAVDGNVSQELRDLATMTSSMLVRLLAVVSVTPRILPPVFVLALVGAWCGNVYMAAQLSVKREMSNRRAPIVAHVAAAVAGVASIRAYGAESAFRIELQERIDKYTRTARVFFNLNRWVSTRIDALGGLFSAGLGAYLIYGNHGKQILPSTVGFSLTMAVGFSGMILSWVKLFNQFEIDANSLERIHAYLGIEQESKPIKECQPPAAWPTSGSLCVENLSAYYSPAGPRVLNNLTFTIRAGERIGVVGRTGSGKSSLALALLRCIFTDGRVVFDGIDTSSITLDTLRTRMSIIPQIPELLSGTLRENLDPFGEHEDSELNAALHAAGFFALRAREGKNASPALDMRVAPGGTNMSVGQRQIVALARALARGSKLLILDEATSSIDFATEGIIQESLLRELGRDVTVLTIAHRLRTIMDSSRIMVLDAGTIVEFDAPETLLASEDSYFRALVNEGEDQEALKMVEL